MRIARFPTNLSTFHSDRGMLFSGNFVLRYGLGETGPTRAAVELVQRAEERFPGDNINVNARLVIVPVSIVKWRLRAAFAGDVILIFRQLAFQLGIGRNWFGWIHFLGFFFLCLSITT